MSKKIFTIIIFLFILLGGFLVFHSANAVGPQTLPLVQKTDLEYLGAFRLPQGENGSPNGFSFGGSPIAFDSTSNTLFVGTKESSVGEIKIPTPVKSSKIDLLPFATMVQNIRDPLEGGLSVLEGAALRGLLVNERKLFGTAMVYYDASNSARVSHFSRSKDLTKPSATPLKALWKPEKSGYVAGWLASVPQEWQSLLGGSILSGNCCVPIVSRTSYGPSAFAWSPSDFDKNPIPATPLLYYPSDHPTLGEWGDSNPIYGGTTEMGGMVIPSGTRSILYFGFNGTGEFCYGTGGGRGGECVDPLSSSKGQHAYPYNYQVWAYDLNDLVKVKDGTKKPWEVKPYATWSIDNFPEIYISGIGGVAYDEEKQIIYVSQARADVDGYSSRAIIHAFKVKNVSKNTTPVYTTPNIKEDDSGPVPEIVPIVPKEDLAAPNIPNDDIALTPKPTSNVIKKALRFLTKIIVLMYVPY